MNHRIYILGSAGSGKTTTAKLFSNKLGIPHLALDDLAWIEKFTKKRSNEEYEKMLNAFTHKNKSWVIEGIRNTGIDDALKSATLIIWLDFHPVIRFFRILKRFIVDYKTRKESIKDRISLIKFSNTYHNSDGHYFKHKTKLEKYKLEFVLIKSQKELNKYISNSPLVNKPMRNKT